jgi:hypothetical protein
MPSATARALDWIFSRKHLPAVNTKPVLNSFRQVGKFRQEFSSIGNGGLAAPFPIQERECASGSRALFCARLFPVLVQGALALPTFSYGKRGPFLHLAKRGQGKTFPSFAHFAVVFPRKRSYINMNPR